MWKFSAGLRGAPVSPRAAGPGTSMDPAGGGAGHPWELMESLKPLSRMSTDTVRVPPRATAAAWCDPAAVTLCVCLEGGPSIQAAPAPAQALACSRAGACRLGPGTPGTPGSRPQRPRPSKPDLTRPARCPQCAKTTRSPSLGCALNLLTYSSSDNLLLH